MVLGSWWRTPHGAFADVMVQRSDGHRVLLAPDPWAAEFVSSTYGFDQVVVTPVHLARTGTNRGSNWSVSVGPLTWDFTVGPRTSLGHLLCAVPPQMSRTHTFARLANPVAARVMPGVQTLGSAGGDRTEWYAAHDLHRLTHSRVHWDGLSLGDLTDVVPAPTFGFSSTPRVPGVTAVTTTIQLPAGARLSLSS